MSNNKVKYKSKLPKITGYKNILCPTTIIWRGYELTFKRVKDKNLMKIERKSGLGKLTVLDLEQITEPNTITETTSGKGIPVSILNTGFIKD